MQPVLSPLHLYLPIQNMPLVASVHQTSIKAMYTPTTMLLTETTKWHILHRYMQRREY